MKKIFFAIFILLLSFNLLTAESAFLKVDLKINDFRVKNETNIKGRIILRSIKDTRSKDRCGGKEYEIGIKTLGAGIPWPLDSKDTVVNSIKYILEKALNYTGYEVLSKDSKENSPVLDIDIADFFCGGYTGYGVNVGFGITVVLKLKIYSSDGKELLYEENVTSTGFFVDNPDAMDYMIQTVHISAYQRVMFLLLLKLDDFFSTNAFLDAYKGKAQKNVNYENIKFIKNKSEVIAFEPEFINYKRISFAHSMIKEILSIDTYKNTEIFDLNNCHLRQIDKFEEISQLKMLTLEGNYIAEIKSLNLPLLEYLSVSDTRSAVNDDGSVIERLAKIPNFESSSKIKYLFLAKNNISKIEGIDNLKELVYLDLSRNKISKIENLDNLENVTYLNLYDNDIKKIENIGKLINLQYLNAGKNNLSSAEGINNLKKLRILDLSNSKIKKIAVNEIENLIELNLSGNGIGKIENLNKLPNLIKLDLDRNNIRKIENLDQLNNLKILILSNNNINKIQNLNGLSGLIELYLDDNDDLKKIEGLENLINLKILDLNDTDIAKIVNLDKLINLEIINIEETDILKLENLEKCVSLKRLYLDNKKLFWPVSKATYEMLKINNCYVNDMPFADWEKKVTLNVK